MIRAPQGTIKCSQNIATMHMRKLPKTFDFFLSTESVEDYQNDHFCDSNFGKKVFQNVNAVCVTNSSESLRRDFEETEHFTKCSGGKVANEKTWYGSCDQLSTFIAEEATKECRDSSRNVFLIIYLVHMCSFLFHHIATLLTI